MAKSGKLDTTITVKCLENPTKSMKMLDLPLASVNFVSKIVKEIDHSKYLKVVLYKTGQQQ